jgi:hypothetical protein
MGHADYLSNGNWKRCNKCAEDKPLAMYYKHSGGSMGVRGQCIDCYNLKSFELRKEKGPEIASKKAKQYLDKYPEARQRARQRTQEWRKNNLAYDAFRRSMRAKAIKQATPQWADIESIKIVYKKAQEYGFHVDHIVPIKSKLVCGLNVHANMQLLDGEINSSKGNRWWPDMPERNK